MSVSDSQWQAFMRSRVRPRLTFADLGHREFRILALQPGEPTDPILCQVVKQDLDHIVQGYTALSYTWGDMSKTATIRCVMDDRTPIPLRSTGPDARNSDTGELQVAENLLGALQWCRRRDDLTVWWVDAICIDQENVDERSQQVLIMAEIYGRATKTLIWLGEASEGTDDGLKLVEDLYATPPQQGIRVRFQPLSEALSSLHHSGLRNILQRSWFRRV